MVDYAVNLESHIQDAPWTVEVPPGQVALVRSLATTPGTIVYNLGGLVDPTATNPKGFKTTDEIALLFREGTWHLYSAKPGTTAVKELYLVAYLKNLAEAAALASLLGSAALNKVDVREIGGTTQTGMDVTGYSVTMSAPATDTPTAASAQALAASATRRFLYVKNVSTGGQRVSFGFGQTAVLDRGITLEPGEGFCLKWPDSRVVSTMTRIANATGGALAIQEGTL